MKIKLKNDFLNFINAQLKENETVSQCIERLTGYIPPVDGNWKRMEVGFTERYLFHSFKEYNANRAKVLAHAKRHGKSFDETVISKPWLDEIVYVVTRTR